MFRLVLIGVLSLIVCCHGEVHWCYEEPECGPDTWYENYPDCGLFSQSPINIVTSETVYNSTLGPLHITDTTETVTAVVTNNGHTVEVVLDSVHDLSSTGLSDIYRLAAFHIHFGNAEGTDLGSEHQIDGTVFPLEMHFVFYNTKYADLAEAKTKSDGLAVIGQLFEIGERNDRFSSIIDILPEVSHKGQNASIIFNLRDTLSLQLDSYYSYSGSLTTPTCSENVAWHVLSSVQQIDLSQYNTIVSSLYFTAEEEEIQIPMADNFRPVQALNERTVYKSEE